MQIAIAFAAASFAFLLPALAVLLVPSAKGRRAAKFPPALIATFFLFCFLSACLYGLPLDRIARLGLIVAACASFVVLFARLGDVVAPPQAPSPRQLAVAAVLAAAAVVTDAWVFSLQGFDFENGLSRFAAPFVGDHWRNVAIIDGLLRSDQSVFFPNSQLVYQVLWHHGAVSVIGILPATETLFDYELGVVLATGLLMYFVLFWVVFALAEGKVRPWWILMLACALAGTDADIYNALMSYVQDRQIALAADSSTRILSPFRYFSLKLVTLTAPQHSAFLVFFGGTLVFLRAAEAGPVGRADADRSFAAAVGFAAAGAVFSPVLGALIYPILFAVHLSFRRHRLAARLAICGAGVAAGMAMFWIALRFPMWDLFLRPNLTGGGSGVYGLKLLPVLDGRSGLVGSLPVALPAMLGMVGVALAGLLLLGLVRDRRILRDTSLIALVAAIVVWNLVIVDTEIQRHFSMVAAFLAVVLVASHLPASGSIGRPALAASLAVVASCAVLNGYFIRAYTHNARFMPLTSAWHDYYCMNGVIRARYSGMSVVAATPRHFELPISVEATTALVWSQVAAVHQRMTREQAAILDRINPRDWKTFRTSGEQGRERFVHSLRSLGFNAVVWGPVEQELFGPVLQGLLTSEERFLESCGFVGLFTLDPGRSGRNAVAYAAHRDLLASNPERLISREAPGKVVIVEADSMGPARGRNVAPSGAARQSSLAPGADARFAIDGRSGTGKIPITLTRNELAPWWEIDLGREVEIGSLRIFPHEASEGPQYDLRDVYILVSSRPILVRSPLEAFRSSGASAYFVGGKVERFVEAHIGRTARYVRIQASDQRHLVLAEVEIYEAFPIQHKESAIEKGTIPSPR